MLCCVWEFVWDKYEGQMCKFGELYVFYLLIVVYFFVDFKFDEICVMVGLLYDVFEDMGMLCEMLCEQFGGEVMEFVDGVFKIGCYLYVWCDEVQVEIFCKLILVLVKDICVIVVKLIDWLYNMQMFEYMKFEVWCCILCEMFEIYLLFVYWFGMLKVQGEFEDLVFFYFYLYQFVEFKMCFDEKIKFGEGVMQCICDQFVCDFEEVQIDCEISYCVKWYYLIYCKLWCQCIDIVEFYDYFVFCVIMEMIKDIYVVFGVVYQNWRLILGWFKDYIVMLKLNFYQLLYMMVVGEKVQLFEVQIRICKMDFVVEEGIVVYWCYKEGKFELQELDCNIVWL